MNHKNTTLAIVAIVAALALTGVAFAVPQQVLAYKHHYNHNSIKVDQQTTQANVCTGTAIDSEDEDPETEDSEVHFVGEETASAPTVCLNTGSNSADIHG
jgi:uncharacterized protein HemX